MGAMPQALVLCGGFGTRLQSVYSEGPKSLVPIAGRPLLSYGLEWLRSEGIGRVVLCTGYRHGQIKALYPEGEGDPEIRYSVEEEPLGTGGAVKKAEGAIDGDCFFVLNGDSFLDVALDEMLAFHKRSGAVATIATVEVPSAARYGSVALDGAGRVVSFLEKTERVGAGPQMSQTINGGLYVLDRSVLQLIPGATKVSIEKEVFPALIGKGIYGFKSRGYFIDVGVPEDLERAQTELPEHFAR